MRERLPILVAAVLFGTTGTAQALAHLHAPVAVGSGRIVVGGALLAAVGLRRGGPGRLRGHGRAMCAAGVGVAVYQLAFFAAVADTGVAVGTVVAIGAAPVLAGALERLTGGPRPSATWAAATALAVAGVAVLVLAGGRASVSPTGVLLALVASAGYAGYAVLGRRLIAAGAPPDAVMGASFGLGALLLLPALAATGATLVQHPRGLGLVAYLGVLPTAVAYLLYARGLRRVEASEAATLGLAEPVTAAVLAVAALGEQLSAATVAGALTVLLGLAVLAAPVRRTSPAAAAEAPA
jgi:DME family drug/metabolite transporter